MKKLISLTAVILILGLLCGCSELAEAEADVLLMMDAFSANDPEAAALLIHPSQNADQFLAAFPNISALVGGRKAEDLFLTSVNVSTSLSGGSQRTETASCRITLEGGSELLLEYTYLEDSQGSGFTAFDLTFLQGSTSA